MRGTTLLEYLGNIECQSKLIASLPIIMQISCRKETHIHFYEIPTYFFSRIVLKETAQAWNTGQKTTLLLNTQII